ncbi:DUF1254 domain-containing protein [Leifsonia poae]|uniref:DUF1254 domain-containing protein n=1 Tax=Leifsonia poae TaxID=110933 RepID=UPI003D66757F
MEQSTEQAKTPKMLNVPNATSSLHPEYVKLVAEAAYVWGYPMVNMINRQGQLAKAPEPGRLNGVVPVAPLGRIGMLNDYIDAEQRFIACPNQDVVYGVGCYSLDRGPIVVQVPDFGSRFYVFAFYDARTDQFGEVGSPYGSKPGNYLLVAPDWTGETPEGIVGVLRSPTVLAQVIPRVFMDDTAEDRAAIQPVINGICAYPLDEFDGTTKTKDWSDVPSFPGSAASGAETKWVVPDTFFDQLATVLESVPPLPGEDALYAQFRALLAHASRDPETLRLMIDAAKRVDNSLIAEFIRWEYNGAPAGNGWNRSVHNAEWGLDYHNRTGTSRSNMFDNRPSETQYFYTDDDGAGEQLTGANTYTVTFAAGETPPVDGFWSLTLYDPAHFFAPNRIGRYSLGTKNKGLQFGEDGSLTLTVSADAPDEGDTNWLPAPDGPFSLYLRAYAGKPAIIDGSWVPPVIARA